MVYFCIDRFRIYLLLWEFPIFLFFFFSFVLSIGFVYTINILRAYDSRSQFRNLYPARSLCVMMHGCQLRTRAGEIYALSSSHRSRSNIPVSFVGTTMRDCTICKQQPAKYKCPTCSIDYCSLGCYKSKDHTHVPQAEVEKVTTTNSVDKSEINPLERIMNDLQIQSMLKYKALQIHLNSIIQILKDVSLTNEYQASTRREIANMKLCNLRVGGVEENELVEDFIQRILYLREQLHVD